MKTTRLTTGDGVDVAIEALGTQQTFENYLAHTNCSASARTAF